MCGRYALITNAEVLAALFGLSFLPALRPRANIAPLQDAWIIRAAPKGRSGDDREGVLLRWGLIPRWSHDASIGNKLINARSESAAQKPSFREAMRSRRCLVPADGFLEWRSEPGGRMPWFVHRASGAPMAMAGLWESWRDPISPAGSAEGPANDANFRTSSEERPGPGMIETFTILTTEPTAEIATLHNRMPCIVPRDAWSTWLDPRITDPATVAPILRPYDEEKLAMHRVSRLLNKPGADDPSLLAPHDEHDAAVPVDTPGGASAGGARKSARSRSREDDGPGLFGA